MALPFPPIVERMSDLADAASFSVQTNTGRPLSFAPDSVADVDVFLGEIAIEVEGSDELAELIFKLGGWPVVKLPSGYYANPIDKAFKRVDNGSQDSLVSFWTAAVGVWELPVLQRNRPRDQLRDLCRRQLPVRCLRDVCQDNDDRAV